MTTIFEKSDKASPGHYNASQTAILLLDWHTLFVEKMGGDGARNALETARQMRDWARSNGIQVIHALIDVNDSPFATCKDGGRVAGMAKAMAVGDAGREADSLVDRGKDQTFLRTPGHVSALKSPGLEDYLRRAGIHSLVLAGLSTSGCVTRTALAAADAEFVVTVLSDGCADGEDGVHEFMIGKILNRRGYVATAAEFQQGFAKMTTGE